MKFKDADLIGIPYRITVGKKLAQRDGGIGGAPDGSSRPTCRWGKRRIMSSSGSGSSASPDWAAVRREFPALQDWTFLNTATYGQLPHAAVQATAMHYARRDALACTDFLEWFDDADTIRDSAARLVNADASDVAFVTNAATALSVLMAGIEWKTGDQVVSLEHEFPNNLYWPSLLSTSGVEFLTVPWSRLYDSLTDRTRLVLVSTVNYSTGFRVPVAELGRVLRERGILFYVDGTQSVGALQFDCRAVKPDMLAVHAYKWLISPNGAGFMYVSPEMRSRLKPSVVGWRSHEDWRRVDSLHHGAPVFVEAAEKYEGGMLNFPSLYAMGASLDFDSYSRTCSDRVSRVVPGCSVLEYVAGMRG